jgi:hypothetical protein
MHTFSLAAEELLSSAHRQSVSASVCGPNDAYIGSVRKARVNRRFLDNTVIQAIGGNKRKEELEKEKARRKRKREGKQE